MIPSDLHSIQPVSSLPSIHVAPTDILTVPNFQDQVPADLPPITTQAVPTPTFEEKIKQASLPPPGPSHYDARRALWLTQSNGPPLPPIPSTSRDKLENLLSRRGAAESEEVWNAGVHKVWKALMAGGRFKRRVPMNLVITIIQAGWHRDGETWPIGSVAPEPDDVLPGPPSALFHPLSGGPMEQNTELASSGTTTPVTLVNGGLQASRIVGLEDLQSFR